MTTTTPNPVEPRERVPTPATKAVVKQIVDEALDQAAQAAREQERLAEEVLRRRRAEQDRTNGQVRYNGD